jgi:hypothetical protein
VRAFPTARILHRLLARDALLRPLQIRQPRKQLVDRSLLRVYVTHRGLNVIVSGDILQRKGVRVPSGREGAEAKGYRVEGFAPTSRAAQKLGEAGMETSTLQKHLTRGQQPDSGEKSARTASSALCGRAHGIDLDCLRVWKVTTLKIERHVHQCNHYRFRERRVLFSASLFVEPASG